ncbi:MAG: S-methyl-5'-thioinosine phosphorylase [Betaproteobacteria bacterium]|nr:S-methyl-5'-thioinosine phosphorylase [Betaproteobacteria bacterium]MSQ87946.1 S-methyl-5'-thioinosine phosphorylase [Betaproteobacteria bacterium]
MLAILGGSGLSQLSWLESVRRKTVMTMYGEPSAPLTLGRIGTRELLFLARHGDGHTIAPHQVNYRANIQALKDAGAQAIVAIATVGGIRREFGPGVLVIPDQIIDYTWGRPSTFFEGPGAKVTHIDFTEPYSAALRARLLAASAACGEAVTDGGVYATTQGPRLETAAEVRKLERDGADLIGMTGMPEAALAREAGIPYAAIAVVANHAAGRGDSAHAISLERIEVVLGQAMGRVRRILVQLAADPDSA